MRATLTAITASLILASLMATPARAQQADTHSSGLTHLLKIRDGSTLLGRLVGESADTIRFETSGGLLVLPRSAVRELRSINEEDVHDGEYWLPDPNSTRLFFTPTGRMLKKGEGYFNDTYLFFLGFAGGLTDNVTLGGGLSVFPTPDFSENVFYLTPKVGLYSQGDFNVAAGALIGFAGHQTGSGGIVYGVATNGGTEGSVSLGAGWLYGGTHVASKPVVMLGGSKRVSRRVSLVTENYLYAGGSSNAVLGYGARFFGDKLSVDLAFLNMAGSGVTPIFPGVPYVAFSTRF